MPAAHLAFDTLTASHIEWPTNACNDRLSVAISLLTASEGDIRQG